MSVFSTRRGSEFRDFFGGGVIGCGFLRQGWMEVVTWVAVLEPCKVGEPRRMLSLRAGTVLFLQVGMTPLEIGTHNHNHGPPPNMIRSTEGPARQFFHSPTCSGSLFGAKPSAPKLLATQHFHSGKSISLFFFPTPIVAITWPQEILLTNILTALWH